MQARAQCVNGNASDLQGTRTVQDGVAGGGRGSRRAQVDGEETEGRRGGGAGGVPPPGQGSNWVGTVSGEGHALLRRKKVAAHQITRKRLTGRFGARRAAGQKPHQKNKDGCIEKKRNLELKGTRRRTSLAAHLSKVR